MIIIDGINNLPRHPEPPVTLAQSICAGFVMLAFVAVAIAVVLST